VNENVTMMGILFMTEMGKILLLKMVFFP